MIKSDFSIPTTIAIWLLTAVISLIFYGESLGYTYIIKITSLILVPISVYYISRIRFTETITPFLKSISEAKNKTELKDSVKIKLIPSIYCALNLLWSLLAIGLFTTGIVTGNIKIPVISLKQMALSMSVLFISLSLLLSSLYSVYLILYKKKMALNFTRTFTTLTAVIFLSLAIFMVSREKPYYVSWPFVGGYFVWPIYFWSIKSLYKVKNAHTPRMSSTK